MKLVISVDVEEEGLFSGRYPRRPAGATNVAALSRLDFVAQEFGLPLTLLVSHAVVQDPAACKILLKLKESRFVEIGAHLHPWNTPPFEDGLGEEPLPTAALPPKLLRAKVESLVLALETSLKVRPRSFRMGRFDWSRELLGLLPEMGFDVDSSVVPLTDKAGGLNNYTLPLDPFYVGFKPPAGPALLEVPVTRIPLWSGGLAAASRLAAALPLPWGRGLRGLLTRLGTTGVHPTWFSLPAMRLAARLHRRRGGQVLNVFFHSSEIFPGASPMFATAAAVDRILRRLKGFLSWLHDTGPVEGLALSNLHEAGGFPIVDGQALPLSPER